MQLRGIVFDLDGTLVHQELDFEAMRREIGLPSGTPLLEALAALPEPQQARAWNILDRHERHAAAKAEVFPGVAEMLIDLAERGIRLGLLSRNSRNSVETILTRCGLPLDPALSREDAPHKPNPQGLLRICETWGFAPAEVLMVGDYLYDLQTGRAAGTRTALVTHGKVWDFAHLADWTIPNLCDLAAACGVALAR
jgi:HAD superfamily hydrolase (TIGR01549 family)